MHGCDNPPCCYPAHLSVGTHTDNMQDARAKGRMNLDGLPTGGMGGRTTRPCDPRRPRRHPR
jgi:hypothetical protein